MDLKNQLTKTPYLVLFVVLISISVGTASALVTITLAGDVDVTGNLDVIGAITGQTITNLQNQINAAGISAETQTQIDNIEGNITSSTFGLEEIKNEVRFIEGNITSSTYGLEEIKDEITFGDAVYVPFVETMFPQADGFDCAPADGFDSGEIRIDSTNASGNFIVSSIVLKTNDIDEALDSVVIADILVDGQTRGGNSGDITTPSLVSSEFVFEIMGYQPPPGQQVGQFPNQFVVNSADSPDVRVIVLCNSDSTNDIDFTFVMVSGWKSPGETINLTYFDQP